MSKVTEAQVRAAQADFDARVKSCLIYRGGGREMSETEVARCRNCGAELRGKPYYMGGLAYLPMPKGGQAPVNYYGGYVCSRSCDYRAALDLEQSMPGHNGQTRLNGPALDRVNANWPEKA